MLVSTSFGGNAIPTSNVIRESDFVLLHGNGVHDPKRITEMVQQTRKSDGYRPMPILFNEDDHFDFDKKENNFTAAVLSYSSWGYFDYRMQDEGIDEGFQSVPVNWTISSDRKRGFFQLLAEITGNQPQPGELPVKAKQITFGPENYFFGYIGHCRTIPWSGDGRYILMLRTDLLDRMPGPDDAAEVVLLDAHQNFQALAVDQTLAWNPQQGTMFYWNPKAPNTQFFFNDRDPETGKVFCVLFDISDGLPGRRLREYRFEEAPVGNSGVSQNGGSFLAINYARMCALQPGRLDFAMDDRFIWARYRRGALSSTSG